MAISNRGMTRFLRMLCAALVVMLGFAHQPVLAYQSLPDELSAYALPDGSLPDLCAPDLDTGKHSGHAYHGCDACRLSGSTVLSEPVSGRWHIVRVEIADAFFENTAQFYRLLFPPSAPPRGPPSTTGLA